MMGGRGLLRLARFAMGTRFEVVLPGADGPGRRAAAEAALEEVAFLDAALDRFRKDSFLSFLNARAPEAPVRLDADLFRLFVLCRRIHRRSLGAFDVTVGPLMEAWGFHEGPADGPAPAEALRRTGFHHVALDGETRTVRFLRPGLSLDFGAVAKGLALDRAAAVLREAGVRRALLHGGTSTVAALGGAPGGGPWKVGLRDPRAPGGGLLGTVCLRDRALSLSAPHGRTQVDAAGRRLGHVLDPATGRPAAGALLCAVVARSAARADAWSTALLAAGPGRFRDLAPAARGVTALLLEEGPPAGEGRLRRSGPHPELFRIQPCPGAGPDAKRMNAGDTP